MPHFTTEEEDDPSEEFIAWHFKTQWCPIGGPHDWEVCVYAHTYRDWRRTPAIGYSSWPCTSWAQSVASGPTELVYHLRCPNGMACPLAHGAKEQLYHPHFYKTSPCSEGNCKRGPLCAFTHGEADTRGPTPCPVSTEEASSKAMQGPLQWAEATLAHHQPSFCNPPRYHALEEQVSTRKGGKGGKKGSGTRRLGEAAAEKKKLRQARQIRDHHVGSPKDLGKSRTQPFYWQMATVYTDHQAETVEQQPFPFTASVLWTHQANPDGSMQSFPVPFLNMPSGDASARLPANGLPDEASPLSAAMAAANACGSPMAVPVQGSTCSFSIPASMWGGLAKDKGSRNHRTKKGQAIRTPSSFGSIGSPRESLTPTEMPATPRTPRSGQEGHRPRSHSADHALVTSKGSRNRTSSADAVLIKANDEPTTKSSTSWASSEST